MPIKNNQTAYQRLQEDLDYRLDYMNKAMEAANTAVNQPAKSSTPSNAHSAVRRQQQLRKMGFYKGAIDGDWGKGSKAAHQAALKNGYILNSYGIYVRKPQSQKALHQKALTETQRRQLQLKQLGFYKGNIDDKFGPQSRAAHQAALDAGYVYDNGTYKHKFGMSASSPQLASIGISSSDNPSSLPETSDVKNPNESKYKLKSTEFRTIGGGWLGKNFPVLRQIYDTIAGNGNNSVQTNNDFSDSYLENLSQLGQVAYRQYRRNNKQPKVGKTFNLPLSASVFKEVNKDNTYANFGDMLGLIGAGLGGDRQVEFTDGQMSGKAVLDENGNIHWFPTDDSSFAFDPGYRERLAGQMNGTIKKGVTDFGLLGAMAAPIINAGRSIRYALGERQEQLDKSGHKNTEQSFHIVFPSDTINTDRTRYSNIPKYKQNR